ncbi:MAG: hypothetical protein DSN69_00675 [Nitrosopumilus sp. YT1]|nr:MAG: hypothetical protein DSN69_00675 [Nitrosopumilus sp. YT1]
MQRGEFCQSSGVELRKIEIGIKDKDYLDFLSICIEEELSVEDKLKNIIRYHLITYRNRKKMRNEKLL